MKEMLPGPVAAVSPAVDGNTKMTNVDIDTGIRMILIPL